jgi:hypothetical protein
VAAGIGSIDAVGIRAYTNQRHEHILLIGITWLGDRYVCSLIKASIVDQVLWPCKITT